MSPAQAGAGHAGAHLRGILLLVAAVFSFSVLDSIGKHLARDYPVPMVVWARYFFHVAIMAVLLWPRMGRRLVQTKRPGLQFARGLGLGLSTVFFLTGLSLMPLAEASAITQIAPVLLAVLAVRFLGEKAPPGTWSALAVSFVGVLLIVRPGGQVIGWAALFPLGTAVCFVVYQLLTRKLSGVDDGLATLFIGALVATLIASLVVPWSWQWPYDWNDAGLFVAMGAIGAFGHLLLIRAFERTPASVLAPYIYLQVVSALLLGWLVFGDFPDLWALAGMGLIALTGVAMALSRRRGAVAAGRTAAVAAAAPGAAAATPGATAISSGVDAASVAATPAAAAIATPAPQALPAAPASTASAAAAASGVPAASAATAAPLRGILLVVGACAMFSLLDSIAKYLSQSHHPMMVAWARYVFHVVVMVALFAPTMGRRLFVTRKLGLQVARGLCLGLSSICFFTSISYLPLAEATALAAIAPVLITVGAVLWLKERAPSGTWLALAFSFAGVLLIVRPGTALFGWPALLPILTAVFTMGYQLLTRQLSGVDNGLATLFIGGAVAATLLSIFAPGTWSLPTTPLDALLFVATGLIGAGSHLLLVRAYEIAPASSLAPFGYMHGVAALVFGLLFFGQFPDALALAGLALIVITGVVMALKNRGARRAG
ncbi:MAG TPA: DMT family transporter [Burkholderiaceae bacterium]|nr:DMT family transporter [Burkholderiaceae bacterium]